MTDQTKKIDIISKAYSEVMEQISTFTDIATPPKVSQNIEQILTKLVDEAYGNDNCIACEENHDQFHVPKINTQV